MSAAEAARNRLADRLEVIRDEIVNWSHGEDCPANYEGGEDFDTPDDRNCDCGMTKIRKALGLPIRRGRKPAKGADV